MPETSAIAKIVLHPGTFSFNFPHTHSNFPHLVSVVYLRNSETLHHQQSALIPQVFQVLMVTVLIFICIIVTSFVFHHHLPFLFRGGLVISVMLF